MKTLTVKANTETTMYLTFGKDYQVIEEVAGIWFKIKGDDGIIRLYQKDKFYNNNN